MPIYVRDNRGGGWWWAHNAIFDHYGNQLGAYGLAIYCCLCRHIGEGERTWIGQKTIAHKVGCTDRTVRKELQKLEGLGLIRVEERVDEFGRQTNIYTLLPVRVDVDGASSTPPEPDSGGAEPDSGAPGITFRSPGKDVPGLKMNKTQVRIPMEQGADLDDEGWKSSLADTMTPASYERWIQPLQLVERANSHAVLRAPDATVADYIEKRLADRLADALGVVRIEVRVSGALRGPEKR